MDQKGNRNGEAGYVLAVVAILLVALCGIAALAIDAGVLEGSRTSAQRAADAGALAGAFTFITNPLAPQPTTAQDHAVAAATRNQILDQGVAAGEVNVSVNVGARLVTVDVARTTPTFFARVYGFNNVAVGARGVAQASPFSTGSACSKPWFVPNTVLAGEPTCDACAAGHVFIQNGAVTSWAMTFLGQQFTIKPGNPQQSLAPGQFYAVRVADSQGGNDYRENIATCTTQVLYCQNLYPVEPGNMIGPTLQGVRDLMGPNPDTYVSLGHYARSDGTVGDTSRQLIVAPVWDACNMPGFCPGGTPPDMGATLQIPVVGFALLFLEGMQGNDVLARVINISACAAGGGGGGGAGSGGGEIGPYSIPVRLVRTP